MFNEGIEVGVIECDMHREREREREREGVCWLPRKSRKRNESEYIYLINKNLYYGIWNTPSTRYIY